MTSFSDIARTTGKETLFGAGIGAIAYGAGQYATTAVNYLSKYVTIVTKASSFADAAGKGVATLGNIYNAAGIVAVGAFAKNVFSYAFTSTSAYVVSKTGLNNVDNWYAKKAGHFVVWTLATTATVATTAYFAHTVLGLALTKTVLGAAAGASIIDGFVKATRIFVDVKNCAFARNELFWANRALTNAKYNEAQANLELNGTFEADMKKLTDKLSTLVNTEDDGSKTLKPNVTQEEVDEVETQIANLEKSTDPKVIGLKGQLKAAQKLDQSISENKAKVDSLQSKVDALKLKINGQAEVKGLDNKVTKEAIKSLAEQTQAAQTRFDNANFAYKATWTA